jgi:hypothetical protein
MLRRFSKVLLGALLLPAGCNFGLKLNPETGGADTDTDTDAVVDTGSVGGSDGSELVGSWEHQTLSTLWTWTAGPTGGCGFSASDGNTSLGEDCNFTADSANFTIESNVCPGSGSYTYELVGPRVLQFTLVVDPSCPDRSALLTDGRWDRLW